VSPLAIEKGVKLIPPKFEDSKSAARFKQIEGDSCRFSQVLINLLTNALSHSNRGTEIRVNLEVPES
jgi:signal transduction histidine kinase